MILKVFSSLNGAVILALQHSDWPRTQQSFCTSLPKVCSEDLSSVWETALPVPCWQGHLLAICAYIQSSESVADTQEEAANVVDKLLMVSCGRAVVFVMAERHFSQRVSGSRVPSSGAAPACSLTQ